MEQAGAKDNKSLFKGIVFILLSVIVSYWLSLTNEEIDKMEMAAILNYFLPGMVGLICLVAFLIIYWLARKFYLGNFWLLSIIFFVADLILGVWLHYYSG